MQRESLGVSKATRTIHYLHMYTLVLLLTLYQPMTHICVMSVLLFFHKAIRIYMEVIILGANTLYNVFCFFKALLPKQVRSGMVGKGLIVMQLSRKKLMRNKKRQNALSVHSMWFRRKITCAVQQISKRSQWV